ncbi:phenylacetate--CoA ligase family protein [Geothermobacter hydrogeniphilus]|uniref:phenylacetate--CoA ligase family protein n=1 Tax=Geothermobacter hydrogeniphilus TaxID=1969733 RepID=UPI00111C173E|nr:phenylacetate--CoA ligase family protein [Geothermobacter hydrogeniphilus]
MNKNVSKYLFYYPSTVVKGEMVFKYLNEYRSFQWRDIDNIRSYQLEKLKKIIRFSRSHSGFYKKLYRNIDDDFINNLTFDSFKHLPCIDKVDLIRSGKCMSTCWKYFSGTKTTGGSTGQPVRVKKNPNALARERAATWRSYEWAGIEVGDRQARFWGVPHSVSGRAKALLTDFLTNRIRLSAFDLSEEKMALYYEMAMSFRPRYLYGYVSVLKMFTKYIEDINLPIIDSVKSIITTSEILTTKDSLYIGSVHGCNVYNEYGCGEVGSIAHTCENGNLHLMADNAYVEIFDQGNGGGEIYVTDLHNLATPLIRYRLGDYAMASNEKCSCGRGLPIIKAVCGRAYDMLTIENGKKIHPEAVIYVFEGIQKDKNVFNQFQVIQTDLSKITIKIVPADEWDDSVVDIILKELKNNISNSIDYNFEFCSAIDREASGKMRIVKGLVESD